MRTRHALRTYVSLLSPVRCLVASRCPFVPFLVCQRVRFEPRKSAARFPLEIVSSATLYTTEIRSTDDLHRLDRFFAEQPPHATGYEFQENRSYQCSGVHLEFTMLVIY